MGKDNKRHGRERHMGLGETEMEFRERGIEKEREIRECLYVYVINCVCDE